MRIIHSAVLIAGTAVAIAAPLHHRAFALVHGARSLHSAHPDSMVVEAISGARCVLHFGEGRTALVGLTDREHMAGLHLWLMALGVTDTSVTEFAIIALPGALADSAKVRIRSEFHEHAGIRVLLDWGGGVVYHHGHDLMLPTVAVVGADARHMFTKSGQPDSASVASIRDALATFVIDARSATANGRAQNASAILPLVRCDAAVHSAVVSRSQQSSD